MNDMRRIAAILLVFSCAALGGCVLPIPHVKKTCGTIEGALLDGDSLRPVEDAKVQAYYPDGGHREKRTDAAGRFDFGSKYRFHWGYLFGVALNYSLPYDIGWWDFSVLTVDAPGYEPICLFGPSPEGVVMERERPEWVVGYRSVEPEVVHMGRDWVYPVIFLTPAERPPSNRGSGRRGCPTRWPRTGCAG